MTCCRPTGEVRAYYDPAPCARAGSPDAPLAEDTPWVVADAANATKTLPNGVVITATRLNQANGSGFAPGPGASSGDPNALGVSLSNANRNSFVDWQFTVSVPQPSTSFVFWDVDWDGPGGQRRERVLIGPPHNRPATQAILRAVVPPFQSSGFRSSRLPELTDVDDWTGGGSNFWGRIRANSVGSGGPTTGPVRDVQFEQAGWLTWPTIGWSTAQPLRMRFDLDPTTTQGTSRGSGYDFRGPIYAEPCSFVPSYAALYCCPDDPHHWRDVETGVALTPAQEATLEAVR